MRFRLGVITGFGVGYYLGAKAGRQRYVQLNRWLHRARDSEAFHAASDKAHELVDLGRERAREFVDEHRPGDRRTPPPDHWSVAAGSVN
jgi:hypothetical protein